jgi:hypothetical protein
MLFTLLIISCSEKTGNLLFTANGEEFVVDGMISREGWEIQFENVLVNIISPEAYNPEKPELKAVLEGSHLVDLKRGTSNRPVVSVGIVPDAETGNYQSLKFSIKQMDSGKYAGYSIVLKGIAEKENVRIPFLIKLNEELTFDGREGYVGDSIKGILHSGKTADVEMTLHFDHLFGNIKMGADDHVNSRSPGFEFFLPYIKENKIDVDQNQMTGNRHFEKLIQGIESLGHLGEGHCEVSR